MKVLLMNINQKHLYNQKQSHKMNTENIVFVEYDGLNRPFQVWDDKGDMYDFCTKNKELNATWAGSGGTYISNFYVIKKPRKLWFKPEFRPTKSGISKLLTNRDISEMGYSMIDKPTHLEEIVFAIENRYDY